MRPINKVAALVTSTGTSFVSKKKIQNVQSIGPISTKKFTGSSKNLSGTKFGRMTVIGMAKDMKKGRWVVRCDCGIYAIRNAKAIENPRNNLDRCEECSEQLYIKRKYHYDKTGKDLPLDYFDN